MIRKNGGSSRPRRLSSPEKLLNRYYALHAERKVRSAVVGILTRLDIPKGDRDGLARVRLQGAGKLTHLLGTHVRIELGSDISGDRCRVESHVVWAAADDYELGAVACFNSEIRWFEAITLRVTNHFHFVNRTRYGGWGYCP